MSTQRLVLLVTALVCATALAVTVLLVRDDDPAPVAPVSPSDYFCPESATWCD